MRVRRFRRRGRAGPVVPPVFGVAAGRSGRRLAGRRRAVGRPAGAGGSRAGRGGRSTSDADALIFYPVPLLPDGPAHRPGPGADRPASGRPRRARPPPAGLPRGVRRRRRAGLPDRGRTRPGPADRFPVATHRQLLLGLGVDDPDRRPPAPGDASSPRVTGGRSLSGLPRPGRPAQGDVDCWPGLFAAYKERHPGPLRLVLAGPVVDAPDDHPDIDVVGPGVRRGEVGAARRGRGPGVPLALGGVLAGGGRGVERPDPGGGQRRLCRHRRALPPVGWGTELRRVRRVRGRRSTC